jgi:hypothetical protein
VIGEFKNDYSVPAQTPAAIIRLHIPYEIYFVFNESIISLGKETFKIILAHNLCYSWNIIKKTS